LNLGEADIICKVYNRKGQKKKVTVKLKTLSSIWNQTFTL